MSENTNAPIGAPGDNAPANGIPQPQTRRERRLLIEQGLIPAPTTKESTTAAATATEVVTAPAAFVDTTPSGSISPITAPDVAALVPIEPAALARKGILPKFARPARVSRVDVRPANRANVVRRLAPRAGRALSKAVKGSWSTTLRGFTVVIIAALMVTLTLPSTGFNLAAPGFAAQNSDTLQVVTASNNSDKAEAITRDAYKVSSFGDLYGLRFGSLNYAYTVVNSGPIRWPFPGAVPISSGYGHRQAPCAACSTEHQGVDFNPGAGTPIYAVADGVVTLSNNDRWGFGRWVVITHNVNGIAFDTVYAHMQRDSVTLNVGDTVAVTDYIGRVGSTGTSTGAHLHLEILVNGVAVDPFTWLKNNTAK